MKNHILTLSLLLVIGIQMGFAQDPITQPQGNYGLTSVLDGAPPGAGFLISEYFSYYTGTLRNSNGDTFSLAEATGGAPGAPTGDIRVNSLLLLNQGVWIDKGNFLGGNFLLDILVPLVVLGMPNDHNEDDAFDLLGDNTVLGDVTIGAGVQWFNKKLFGLPHFSRLELDLILPTGSYEEGQPVNTGSGFFSFQPYYAQTLFFNKKTSLSLRHHLTFNGKRDLPDGAEVRAGAFYHVNYSLETLIGKSRFKPGESGETRLAVQGYYGTQFNDDELNGVSVANSKENVFAVGPSVYIVSKKGIALEFKTAFEVSAENRTKGLRSTFRFIKYFPPKKKSE